MKNNYFEAFNLDDTDIAQLKFPILVWSDVDDENSIVLLPNKNDAKVISEKNGKSFRELLEIDEPNFNNFLNEANLGDETQHVFKIVEFENGIVNWEGLIKEYKDKKSKLPHKEGDFEKSVVDELNQNYIQDLKASFMDCIYNSIIFNLHALASELIIDSIGFLGELSYQERFRQIIHKHLNAEYNVILGN
jgi:uncharacterized protein (UPF0216 family)